MPKIQPNKKIFLTKEGDEWFKRTLEYRQAVLSTPENRYVKIWEHLPCLPQKTLEIGCSDGLKLEALQQEYSGEYHGIDPSLMAVEAGKKRNSALHLTQGVADDLPYENEMFDGVIFGGCLCMCDRQDLFKIAYETDRILKEKGFLIIADFMSDFYYRNSYKHHQGIYTHKMDYSRMFLWNPQYILLEMLSTSVLEKPFDTAPDERRAVHILYKKPIEDHVITDPYN